MSDPSTARTNSSSTLERRAERQARHARILRSSLDRNDVSQAELALAVGVAPSKVARWLDPEQRDRPGAHEMEAFPDAVALDLLREIAIKHGFTLAPLPVGKSSSDDVQLLAASMKETAEAISAGASCIRPGIRPDRVLLQQLVRESTEAIETMAALRERATAELADLDTIPLASRRHTSTGAR